jgi:hypothetical protein
MAAGEKSKLGSIICTLEALGWFDDAACMGKNSPSPVPCGGDAPDQSDTDVSAVMRLLSSSAPGNVNSGCPPISEDWGGDIDCPFTMVSSGRTLNNLRDGDNGCAGMFKNGYALSHKNIIQKRSLINSTRNLSGQEESN